MARVRTKLRPWPRTTLSGAVSWRAMPTMKPAGPPPNLHPLDQVLHASHFFGAEDLYSLLVCPVCAGIYNHHEAPVKSESQDDYKAWTGRGDLLVIPLWGECGSQWEICLGFHKGETSAFVRVRRSCTEASFLYFIEAVDTGFIKIGRSADTEKRIAQLATGSPAELRLLARSAVVQSSSVNFTPGSAIFASVESGSAPSARFVSLSSRLLVKIRLASDYSRPPNPRYGGRHPSDFSNIPAPGVDQPWLRSAARPSGAAELMDR